MGGIAGQVGGVVRSSYEGLTAKCSQGKWNVKWHPAVTHGKSELRIDLVQVTENVAATLYFQILAVFC